MTSEQLQTTVVIEGLCLCLMLLIIVSSYYRWRLLFYTSSLVATLAFFTVWHALMALGALLTYGPASLLLWLELDKKSSASTGWHSRIIRMLCWSLLASGVLLLILKNILNIYDYLS